MLQEFWKNSRAWTYAESLAALETCPWNVSLSIEQYIEAMRRLDEMSASKEGENGVLS